MTDPVDLTLEKFRVRAIADRRSLIERLGPETFDQGLVLVQCGHCGHTTVITDAFDRGAAEGPIDQCLAALASGWWSSRRRLEAACPECQAEGETFALAGLYARYLPEVGFDHLTAFEGEGPVGAFRVDAASRVTSLKLPTDELMFRDQTGTFFDLRAGWRHLVAQFEADKRPIAVEAQSGYLIGVRAGDPSHLDPAEREDEALQALFSRWDPHRYDALEFPGHPSAPEVLAPGEGPAAWLPEAAAEAVNQGQIELFVLAESASLWGAVEDLAEALEVEAALIEEDEEAPPRVRLTTGPVSTEVDFALPYLRTLHGGLTFAEGARAWFGPALRTLAEARALIDQLKARLNAYAVTVTDGTRLVITPAEGGQPVVTRDLITLAGRQVQAGSEGVEAVLKVLGYDAETGTFTPRPPEVHADGRATCPTTGEPARVGKIIRPLARLGVDPRTLAGVPIGQHFVGYTIEGPTVSTPVEASPDLPLQLLEAAWLAGQERARLTLLDARNLILDAEPDAEVSLLVAFDAGSLLLEPRRLQAALEAAELPAGGKRRAYAFYPDALVLSDSKLVPQALRQARRAALDVVQAHFPGRDWSLDAVRMVDLEVAPAGEVEGPEG